jgi:hypothetical protein
VRSVRYLEKQRTNSEATEHDEQHSAQAPRSALSGEQEDHRNQRTSDQGEHQRTVDLLVAVDSREGLADF